MRIINKQELKDILDKHDKFLKNEDGGECADLRYADLRSANLSYANLSSANLSYANLRSADLSYADLITFQFQQHVAYYTFDGALRIGCIVMPISEWILGFEEIGKKNRYSKEQILMYGQFINQCSDHFNRNNK